MRYFAAMLAAFAALAVLYHAVSGRLLPPSPDIGWILELEKRKWGAAEAADSPRILIIGGSEAHYGLSAKIFEAETGLPAINLATHAGLSWRAHVRNTRALIRPGDIVVFSVNYARMIETAPRDLEVRYWRRRDPWAVFDYPVAHWRFFIGGDVLGEILRAPGEARIRGWLRRARAITPRGDETRNRVEGDRDQSALRAIRKSGGTPPFDPRSPGLADILLLQDAAQAEGARFYAVFPGQLERRRYRDEAWQAANLRPLAELLREAGVETLNAPEDALLPIDLMYDTIYHPTDAGRRRITRPAAEALAARLAADGVIPKQTTESAT